MAESWSKNLDGVTVLVNNELEKNFYIWLKAERVLNVKMTNVMVFSKKKNMANADWWKSDLERAYKLYFK